MPNENAFTVGLDYTRKTDTSSKTTEPKEKNARWKEDRWKWSIATQNDAVRQEVLSALAKLCNDKYGPTTHYFADRHVPMIDIPYEIMREISGGVCEDFIIFNKISEGQQWSISKTYTKGDLNAYFGARFQGTYKTTGKKNSPQKVL